MATIEDRIYAAALIDGEGCIMIQKGNPYYSLRIVVCMTSQKVIKWLCDTFGGEYYEIPKRECHRKIQHRWRINGSKAAYFITEILPYLKEKDSQALLAIDFGKTKAHPKPHMKMSMELQERKALIYTEMRKLNSGGMQ